MSISSNECTAFTIHVLKHRQTASAGKPERHMPHSNSGSSSEDSDTETDSGRVPGTNTSLRLEDGVGGGVRRLNRVLERVGIPIVLGSPQDLTPRLLIALLESLLQSRLPLSSSMRGATSIASRWSKAEKVEAMKVFLGVLGDDVLGDVSSPADLAGVDPRRLAEGGEGECEAAAVALVFACERGLFEDLTVTERGEGEILDAGDDELAELGAVHQQIAHLLQAKAAALDTLAAAYN